MHTQGLCQEIILISLGMFFGPNSVQILREKVNIICPF